MSYSRWGASSWYVFWNCSSGQNQDHQVLSAWYTLDTCIDWTYAEVDSLFVDGITSAAQKLELRYNCNPEDANELQELMQEWMADVREKFNT